MEFEAKLWVFIGVIVMLIAAVMECYRYRAWRGTGKLSPMMQAFPVFLVAALAWPGTLIYIYSLIRMEDVE